MSRRHRSRGHESTALSTRPKDARLIARYRRKRRRFVRIVRAILGIVLSTFVIIPAMIAGGLLLGPSGYEGLFLAPLVLFATWAAILYWALRKRVSPTAIVRAQIAQLPAQTEEWLEEQRARLPAAAQSTIDSLADRLEQLTPQVEVLPPDAPAAMEIRRLLSEELPQLVQGYRKVPRALAQQPLYGGPSPERQLLEGLDTIDKQIGRVHERLAADDLHALATHRRYLELKYDPKDDGES